MPYNHIKLFFTVLPILVLLGCSKVEGFIYDEKRNLPLEGVLVIDIDNISNNTLTKDNGKFSFYNSGNLIISKEGYVTDTLRKYGCKPKGKCFDGHIFYMKEIEK